MQPQLPQPPPPQQPPDDDASPDSTLVGAALERPAARYVAWAEKPDVARALAQFRSERDIRKTGRLDLVTWVQYICAFGYQGPPDEAWAGLFAACRVLPMLSTDPDTLREHEIAVLLAYAKIKPDNGDSMTPAQLVKHRIKPAVLGRAVARTPGILQHIRAKFEHWALGPFTDMFCDYCVSLCGPSSYMPGIDDMPTTQVDIGDSIRQCADAHANTLLKTWGGVVSTVLDLDTAAPTSFRVVRFEQKLHEKRKFMYQHIFIKISEYWFNLTQQRAFVPHDRDSLQYRQNPFTASHSAADRLLFAKETPDTKLRALMKKVISRTPIHRTIPPWSTVRTHITICELHKPSRYGLAGLDFFQSDNIKTNLVRLVSAEQGSTSTPSKTNVRIGSFNSPTITAEIHGVPPNQMCRALRLQLSIGVLAPKHGSTRPRFQVTGIEQATWVELRPDECDCTELDPVSEMGMDTDESEDKEAKDRLHRWFGSSGIGKYLALGAGCHWETFDLCEGMSKHNMNITVPQEVLRRVRVQSKVSEQTNSILPRIRAGPRYDDPPPSTKSESSTFESCASIDMDVDAGATETFVEPCWIDCHTGARLTYIAPPGVELFAISPKHEGIFKNSPLWKYRAP